MCKELGSTTELLCHCNIIFDNTSIVQFAVFGTVIPQISHLPRWFSWLRHSAHRPGRSVRGAGVQFSVGR